MNTDTKEAWRSLYKQGYWLIPLKPQGKKALVEWTMFQKERPSGKTIAGWLEWQPSANPGLVTGRGSKVIVMDIDGADGVASIVQKGGDLPSTPISKTARGFHYLFAYPELEQGQRVVTKAGVLPGLDSRGDGGYIVAPGGIHESNHVYEWYEDTGDLPLAQAPQWWLDLVVTSDPDPRDIEPNHVPRNSQQQGDKHVMAYCKAALQGEVSNVQNATDGTKHDQLFISSLKLGGLTPFLSENEIETALYDAIRDRAKDTRAALKTIRDGIDCGSRRQRQIPEPTLTPRPDPPTKPTPSPKQQEAEVDEEAQPDWTQDGEQQETQPVPEERWKAVPLSELVVNQEKVGWIWQGYLAPRMTTLLTGLQKSGKTTLLSQMYKALEGLEYDFIGQQVRDSKVLVVSEEIEDNWVTRRDELGLGDHIHVICEPFRGFSTYTEWGALISRISDLIDENNYDVVVFDTLFNMWPVEKENDNMEVKKSTMMATELKRKNVAVLLVAHGGKEDKSFGKNARGASSIATLVDVLVEFRPYDSMGMITDNRRILEAKSRYRETPDQIVLDYSYEQGYVSIGTKREAERDERWRVLVEILPTQEPGFTIAQLIADWPDDVPKPSRHTLGSDLDYAAQNNVAYIRKGEGTQASPYRYYHAVGNEQWNHKSA